MKKKTFVIAGVAMGVIVALLGVLVLAGAFPDSPVTASSAPYNRDSGYATFGADFYTIVSNNAEEAAVAGRATASNLVRVFDLIRVVGGVFLIGFGLMGACFFGMQLEEKKPAVEIPPAEPAAPVEAELPEI